MAENDLIRAQRAKGREDPSLSKDYSVNSINQKTICQKALQSHEIFYKCTSHIWDIWSGGGNLGD